MTQSEFWSALEKVFGSVLGHSLVQDLYLPKLGGPASEAMENGVDLELIWECLIEEVGAGEDARWVHRRAKRPHSR